MSDTDIKVDDKINDEESEKAKVNTHNKKTLLVGGVIFVLLLIVAFGILFSNTYVNKNSKVDESIYVNPGAKPTEKIKTSDQKSFKVAIVEGTNSSLNVRTEPNTESEVIGNLYDGDAVELVGEGGDWFSVKYKGNEAWIHKEYVKESTLKYAWYLDQDVKFMYPKDSILKIDSGKVVKTECADTGILINGIQSIKINKDYFAFNISNNQCPIGWDSTISYYDLNAPLKINHEFEGEISIGNFTKLPYVRNIYKFDRLFMVAELENQSLPNSKINQEIFFSYPLSIEPNSINSNKVFLDTGYPDKFFVDAEEYASYITNPNSNNNYDSPLDLQIDLKCDATNDSEADICENIINVFFGSIEKAYKDQISPSNTISINGKCSLPVVPEDENCTIVDNETSKVIYTLEDCLDWKTTEKTLCRAIWAGIGLSKQENDTQYIYQTGGDGSGVFASIFKLNLNNKKISHHKSASAHMPVGLSFNSSKTCNIETSDKYETRCYSEFDIQSELIQSDFKAYLKNLEQFDILYSEYVEPFKND